MTASVAARAARYILLSVLLLACSFFFVHAPQAQAAALSNVQIQALIKQLSAAGANQGAINLVQQALATPVSVPAQAPTGQYIVVLKNDALPKPGTRPSVRSAVRTFSQGFVSGDNKAKRSFVAKQVFTRVLDGFSASLSNAEVSELKKDPKVAYVVPDGVASAAVGGTQAYQNGVRRIHAAGSPTTGAGIHVAVIDTGIDQAHPDLSANLVNNYNCSDSPTTADVYGHGTHVAGIVAALDNTIGVVGVAPAAKVWNVKVLGDGGTSTISAIICGLDYVTANAPANGGPIKIANLSIVIGTSGPNDNNCGLTNNDPLHSAACRARDAGVTLVVSAGNNGTDTTNKRLANYDDAVITVSALQDTDGRPGGLMGAGVADDYFASFSNFGSSVDIGAPGVSIYSTVPTSCSSGICSASGYNSNTGTSMAAPHVAGAAALYLAANPGASWTAVRNALVAAGESWGTKHFAQDINGHPHLEPVVLVSPTSFIDNALPPRGTLESVTCAAVVGWSQDEDVPTQSNSVRFFIDGNSNWTTLANLSRPDLQAQLGSSNHGFSWSIPAQFHDGLQHTLVVKGVDTLQPNSNDKELSGSPKIFQCGTPVPAPTASITANGASTLNLKVGDPITFAWSSTGGTSAQGSFTINPPGCGKSTVGPHPWVLGNTLSGSWSGPADACTAGRTLTDIFTVTNAQGKAASSSVTIVVSPKTPPTCTLSYSPTALTTNDPLTITWGATDALLRTRVVVRDGVASAPVSMPVSGSATISPVGSDGTGPGSYVRTDTVIGPGGVATCSASMVISPPPVTVVDNRIPPRGTLDVADGQVAAGWSQDQDTPTQSNEVHFYIDGAFAGAATANIFRSDLVGPLGSGNHGFSWNIPAQYCNGVVHSLAAYGIDTTIQHTNNNQLAGSPKNFTCGTVDNHISPTGWLDSVSGGVAGGWAQDKDTPTKAIDVHFYIDGVYIGAMTAGNYRADLVGPLGSGNHGFSWNIPAQYCNGAPHTMVVYGMDSTATAANVYLSGVPKSFTCGPVSVAPDVAGFMAAAALSPWKVAVESLTEMLFDAGVY